MDPGPTGDVNPLVGGGSAREDALWPPPQEIPACAAKLPSQPVKDSGLCLPRRSLHPGWQ